MVSPAAIPLWWEFSIRGVTLRGTVQARDHDPKGDAAAVVAVHGGPGIDGGGLRHVLSPLADEARIVVPDLRGHGRSDLGTSLTWTLDEWADDLAEVIAALQVHNPIVVGMSFGGWVALRYAARHAGQPGSLIIAAMTARLPTFEQSAERMRALGGPISATAWLAAHAGGAGHSNAEFEDHVVSLMAIRTATRELAAVRAAQIKTPQVNEHFTPRFSELDLTEDVARIQCPLTVLVGERDPLTTPELARATADASAGPSRLRVLPDVAHDLLVDAPDALLAEIRCELATREHPTDPG